MLALRPQLRNLEETIAALLQLTLPQPEGPLRDHLMDGVSSLDSIGDVMRQALGFCSVAWQTTWKPPSNQVNALVPRDAEFFVFTFIDGNCRRGVGSESIADDDAVSLPGIFFELLQPHAPDARLIKLISITNNRCNPHRNQQTYSMFSRVASIVLSSIPS